MSLKVTLTYTQRLNLRSLIGQWRGWSVTTDMPRIWKVMAKLDLSDEEKAAINHRRPYTPDGERDFWDNDPANPPADKELEFHDKDVARIKNALRNAPFAGNDRPWLEGILKQFMPEVLEGE